MSKHSRNFNSIPPRWLGCPRKSLQLLDEKFLIFKTPLSHDYDNRVPDECLFPVDFVFNSMASYKLKLGLWIDLTFTSRFYDKKEVESHGCKYFKLQCRGFGQTPSPEQTQTFIHLCQSFISENPLEIIGVHCTHGFNRSGFMLVSFLVENYGWELGAALLKFAEVRPPGIYKKDYLLELYKKYDDEEFVPEPPPLPNWCYDLRDDKLDDDDNNDNEESAEVNCRDSSSKPKVKRTKVFVKKNPTFMAGVPGVEPVTSSETNIQAEVQRLCEWERYAIDNIFVLCN